MRIPVAWWTALTMAGAVSMVHSWPSPFTTRILLDNDDGGTRLTLIRPYPAERRASAQAGWGSSLDKLEALPAGSA